MHEDIIIRNYINKKLKDASISKINIERTAKDITITIFTSRPGIVIGKGGSEVEKLKKDLVDLICCLTMLESDLHQFHWKN